MLLTDYFTKNPSHRQGNSEKSKRLKISMAFGGSSFSEIVRCAHGEIIHFVNDEI